VQQQQQYDTLPAQEQQLEVVEDIDSMLCHILQSVQAAAPPPPSQSLVDDTVTPRTVPSQDVTVGLGKGEKNISRFAAAPPRRTRRRKSRSYYKTLNDNRHALMMSNVVL